jgi:nitroreductase
MLTELIQKNRSYRRYQEEFSIGIYTLKELVNFARLSSSAGNLQPLKYTLSCDRKTNALIFSCLSWARFAANWLGPREGERPSAYIIVLGDTEISSTFGCDHGIAAQSILLGAAEKELGGCIIGSFDKEALRKALNIPHRHELLLVIALGKPRDQVKIETAKSDGDVQFWRDEQGVNHVPKRSLEDIIVTS